MLMYLVVKQLNMAGFLRTRRSDNVPGSGPGSSLVSRNTTIGELHYLDGES